MGSLRARRLHVWGRALVIVGSLASGGCATKGDFGRVRPSLVSDDIHSWIGPQAASAFAQPASVFPLTDDERQLRDLAYPLIEPPYERNRWYSIVNEYGISRAFGRDWFYFDLTAYAAKLLNRAYRSPSARYAQLMEDIRNDIVRIEPFFATAFRVVSIDRKREKSLAYVSVLTPSEEANAIYRVNENLFIVGWVQHSLAQRAASYRFALERLLIATPSPAAVEAERLLTQLQARIAQSQLVPELAIGAPVPVAQARKPHVSK